MKYVIFFFVGAAAMSYAALLTASEAVRPQSASLHSVGGSNVEIRDMKLPDLLDKPDIKQFVNSRALPKYREDHDCPIENTTKDRPTSKAAKNSLSCSDLLTVPQANAKSDSLENACKKDCQKGGVEKVSNAKSANAVADCLQTACEKECEFKNTAFKAELESYVKGAIEQHGADLEAIN